MNKKIKKYNIIYQAEQDRSWAALRENKGQLASLVENIIDKKQDECTMDFILCLQCLRVVLNEIEIYEEDSQIDDDIKEILSDKTQDGILKRLQKETDLWSYVTDNTNPIGKRFDCIKKVRDIIWGHLSGEKNKIKRIIKFYQNIKSQADVSLIVQCISIVLMDLEIKDIEIEILERGMNNEI